MIKFLGMKRPPPPQNHNDNCPCGECERWATAEMDWQEDELEEGRDPFASSANRIGPGFYR